MLDVSLIKNVHLWSNTVRPGTLVISSEFRAIYSSFLDSLFCLEAVFSRSSSLVVLG